MRLLLSLLLLLATPAMAQRGKVRDHRITNPQVWQRVHQTLLDRPNASYQDVAGLLRRDPKLSRFASQIDATAVTRLIDRFSSRTAVFKERDRATAQLVARRLRTAPADARGSLRDMARLLQSDLPGIADHNLVKLKRRHPDLLGALAPRAMHKPVPKPARTRIAELALANPTLDYAQLARLFKKDPALKNVLPWSEEQVARLREPSRILPSETRRVRALAKVAAEHFATLSDGSSLDAAVTSLKRTHPGADAATLVHLAHNDRNLAAQIRRLETRTGGSGGWTEPTVDISLARALNPGVKVVQRVLEREGSALVQRFRGELQTLEREQGTGSGRLAPGLLRQAADPELVEVMKRVYRKTGRKTLPLERLYAVLPSAVASAAYAGRSKGGALGSLYRSAVQETVTHLAGLYRHEVVRGGGTTTAFHDSHGMSHRTFSQLQRKAAALFPKVETLPLSGDRLDGVARLYGELLAGRLTTTGFYSRSKIGVDELRMLQATDPRRFPRPEGTPSYRSVSGRRDADTSEGLLTRLSRAWNEQVVTGQQGINEFARTQGLGKRRLTRMRHEHPASFPKPKRAKRPTKDDAGRAEMARIVGRRAQQIFERDVLVTQADLLAALNSDARLVARFGKLTISRYQQLHPLQPGLFPDLKNRAAIKDRLANEVREILRREPGLQPNQVAERMLARHPRFKRARLHQLRREYPGLIEDGSVAAVPAAQRRQDASKLARLLEAAGGKRGAIARIAEDLGRREPRFTRAYCYRLRREFERELFSSGATARRPTSPASSSLAVQEVYALLIRLAPPGTSEARLASALNRYLVENGLPTYSLQRGHVPTNISRAVYRRHGTLREQSARVAAEIVAEYAAAAPRGTAEARILDQVRADYPAIDLQKLSRYRNMWARSPASYPALAAFVTGGTLGIQGQGRRPAPRYRGGWDVEKAVLGAAKKDPALARDLATQGEFARIPQRLPLLDRMVADLKGGQPLRGKNVLWVSHLLGSTVPLARALRDAGTLAKSTIVVGTPYGTNPAVKKTLADDGFDVRVPALSPRAYRQGVKQAVDDMVARHRRNHKPVVVLDDGGLVTEILHSDPRYADVLGAFKIVEQTTRGITVAEQRQLKVPVVNVARSAAKRAEGRFIGQAVATKVVQGLGRLGRDLGGARVTVIGYGVVGSAVARELAQRNARVTVVETGAARAREARRAGYAVAEKSAALPTAQVVIGATGNQSLTLADMRQLHSGVVVASASSKQLELDMEGLGRAASRRTLVESGSPLVRLPTARYTLGRAEITVLGDGWPVNFDGDVEDIPAGLIQITRAAMFAGAIQAAGIKTNYAKNRGIIALDAKVDRLILRRFNQLHRERQPTTIHDPDRWADGLRRVAGYLQP